jgi:phage antirepressor YoqD-like protein
MSHKEPISVRRFAEHLGISERCLLRWCRDGKVIGARKHPLTKRWVIYPPARLATGTNWRFPALKGGAA